MMRLLFQLFHRPDLAERHRLEALVFKTQIRLGDEIVAHRETFARLCAVMSQKELAEKALNDVIHERIDRQVRLQHEEFQRDQEEARKSLVGK